APENCTSPAFPELGKLTSQYISVPTLIEAIEKSWSAEIRANAAYALGELRCAEALPHLREVARTDPEQHTVCVNPLTNEEKVVYPVREAAEAAIKAIESGSLPQEQDQPDED
ncbi:MAG: HEAT repeat domain-containing protein, partial [Planctomycetota bacterium]|nr:HEAT repeat domain-containing protein [Planctomycetota bacterium]